MKEETVVVFKKFSAGFECKKVLYSVSFKLYKSKINVIVGPGGSGKSTILNILNAEKFNGQAFWSKGEFINKLENISFTPQNSKNIHLSISDLMPDVENKLKSIWYDEPEVLELLISNINEPLNKINKKVERLAHLSIALTQESDTLILDEPEAHDYKITDIIIKKILELKGNKTLIINTHNIHLTQCVADYVTFLKFGKIVESSNNKSFFNSNNPLVQDILKMGC